MEWLSQVRFNHLQNDDRFLILDPHYKDAEDIKTVVDKVCVYLSWLSIRQLSPL